jgi:hypothetical protein
VDIFNRWVKSEEEKWELHPLMHTRLFFNLVQDVEKKGAEPKISHFLSLNQDIITGSQEQKCALKYVILSCLSVGWGFI